ncbi:bifunctional folylpolyglutamate synthase/dihydrofolate synthase [Aestuariimicrobium ganziense]|uniref:bifunctional folylpolyglutamate synthase/dihydrofolate synthase n=1 Tax=Aestuariimicrobium ganziense TaxID=2773677 RepID=UPI0019450354|nr:folylpolyglutamate synthase/dihydrofolate synthase family protein [Aestuariimicrobium ganziense]
MDSPAISTAHDAARHATLVAELQARWPEHRIAPSLGRVQALCDLLGNPERSAPVIQVAGTNGKGSTALMIDALLRSEGLRTGRVASPHLQDLTERICIDGHPISRAAFADLYDEVKPFIDLVDAQAIDGVQMTFFEVMTGLAFAAFADAPVDVMVLEVGLGGTWDATNVADADVAVICPIDLDHTHILGSTVAEIAAEKAGIIKPGATAVIAGQTREAAEVLLARCAEVGADPVLEGPGFGLLSRELAVGGQVLRINGAEGPIGDLHLPLHGRHMAENAALAVAAVESFLGGRALPPEVISDGLADVVAPARLEVVRRSPTVVLDTAHNPHGVRATLEAVHEAFTFQPLVGVVAMMGDKAVDEVFGLLADQLSHVVVTTISSTSRALSVDDLADIAEGAMGVERVDRAATMAEALDRAMQVADEAGPAAGVLVIGSLMAAGEARDILGAPEHSGALGTAALEDDDEDDW